MLTWEENIDAHAQHKRGWTISAIARHLGRDRKTIRAYLADARTPGQRKPAGPDGFARFTDYVAARLEEDPHLWATTLFDELADLGFTGSYPTLTRQIRTRGLRPVCQACATVADRRPPPCGALTRLTDRSLGQARQQPSRTTLHGGALVCAEQVRRHTSRHLRHDKSNPYLSCRAWHRARQRD